MSEELALRQWAEEYGKIIPSDFFEEKEKRGEIAFRAEEFEHVVYHDPSSARAIKLTRPGTFGMMRGVLEYFDRLDFCNHIFGDDFRVVGLTLGEGDRFRIVTSQPWIPLDKDAALPTLDEIEAYFEKLEFQMYWPGAENPAFYREDLDLIARDAHEGNFIRYEGRLVPIDVIIERPSSEQRADIAAQLGIEPSAWVEPVA